MAEVSHATRLRERLRSGPPLVGTFVKLPAPESIDLARSVGFDLAVVDGEHSQLDEGAILSLLRHAAALDFPMLVRTLSRDPGSLNRLLEAGAAGIQLSTLRACAERDAIVSATRYAPDGTRSVSLAHPAADYSAIPLTQYLERSRQFPLLVGQIETASTVDPLREILRGLDAAFIGTTDLSVDLGRPGMLDDPLVTDRVAEIAAAASSAGVALGAWVASPAALGKLGDARYRYVLIGSDVQALRAGLSIVPSAARMALS
ncbi:MAG TPA: aldolase/citrate lyase family protein [Candidatus Limnocylindria bacterium]|jgi:4-hydroxy-2-oxoheptanedioate aldolase|nr:aldolase/citrate lyase family protein [Candidatus Limnocylindria bacterium]